MTDYRVNAEQWNAISTEDQTSIIEGLRSAGALKIGDKIIPDAKTKRASESGKIELLWNPIGDACRAACDATAAAAIAWCTTYTAGAGLIACIAAAEAVRRECNSHC